MAFYHTARMGILHRRAGALAGRLPDRPDHYEQDYSVEWVPERELHLAHEADAFNSWGLQVSVPSNDDAD